MRPLARLSIAAVLAASLFTFAHAGAQLERGRELVIAGDCRTCHTAPSHPEKPFAGGFALHAYFGTVYSPNITPDAQTGIGKWTADQFWHAMHDGIDDEGAHLYPAFPYVYFAHLSRADIEAIFAYLHTLKPIHNVTPTNRLIFPADMRWVVAVWDWLFLDKSPLPSDPSRSAEWNRGYRLVNGVGHCSGCHTPKNFLFVDEGGRRLQGATLDGWYAPNLTPAPGSAFVKWNAGDIVRFLATGENRFGRAVGSMKDVVGNSTSKMSDADRKAIAVYLKSLPPGPARTPAAPAQAQMDAGRGVFERNCSACHEHPEQGYPDLGRHNTAVDTRDPITLVRVILQGSQSLALPGHKIGLSMPSFASLSDKDVADVASFLRHHEGNAQGPVGPGQVKTIRALIMAPR